MALRILRPDQPPMVKDPVHVEEEVLRGAASRMKFRTALTSRVAAPSRPPEAQSTPASRCAAQLGHGGIREVCLADTELPDHGRQHRLLLLAGAGDADGRSI